MTPTTAEQMPQPNWELVLQCVQIKANACISPELASLYTEQHAVLTSWLAQGGARCGEALQELIDDVNHAKGFLSGYGGPAKTAADFLRDAAAKAIAALAPRAEAGEAVFKNGDRVIHRGKWNWPESKSQVDMVGTYRRESGVYVIVEFDKGQKAHLDEHPEQCVYVADLRRAQPTAACGVSGLVDDSAMTAKRAAWFLRRFQNEEKLLGPNEQAALVYAINQLEAALKANRGGVSDQQVEAAMTAYYAAFQHGKEPRVYYTEEQRTDAMRAALTAALNAGALAGGEAVRWEFRVRLKGIWHQWWPISQEEYVKGRKNAHPNVEYRSLVVGGVGL